MAPVQIEKRNIMGRYEDRRAANKIFLVIDEFAALRVRG